jgi:uncharacterized protein YbaR (Trm112 family)
MGVNRDLASLLDALACPVCTSGLALDDAGLHCVGCARSFPLRDGVPVLLADDGRDAAASWLGRLQYALLGNPRVYEFQQEHGGAHKISARVAEALDDVGGATVLDVGAGTGMVGRLLPPGARYIWLDNDTLKLRGLLARQLSCDAVLGDAARLPFRDASADWTAMVEVSHHLPDAALAACLAEVARVTRDRLLFVEQLQTGRLRSRILWQLDLGRFPRTEEEVVAALETSFAIENVERFRVNHDHLLCVCAPRPDRRLSSSG